LARAEDEVDQEITLRLPVAKRNVATLIADAQAEHRRTADEPSVQTALVSPVALAQPAVQQGEAIP
jgi:hypothetical protein